MDAQAVATTSFFQTGNKILSSHFKIHTYIHTRSCCATWAEARCTSRATRWTALTRDAILQIAAQSGGAWVATFVHDHFVALLCALFAAAWMKEFRLQESAKYVQLMTKSQTNFRAKRELKKSRERIECVLILSD